MMSIDQGKPVIHVLLDLSTAVDTVDHNIPLGKKTCLVCQVEYLNGLDPIWNNALRECLFMVFYLTFSFCYLVYHMVQLLVLWFPQCIPVLLESLRSDVGLNITCMLMTHLYISLDADNELNFSSSLNNLEHCIADIRLWMTQNLLKLENMIISPQFFKNYIGYLLDSVSI